MTALTKDQFKLLLGSYRLEDAETVFLRHSENETYKLTDQSGRSCLLRIHHPFRVSGFALPQHQYDGLLAELQMLYAWADASEAPVQRPLRNMNGHFITTIRIDERDVYCSVLTWLEGKELQAEDMRDEVAVRQVGARLAELHAFLRQYGADVSASRPSQGIEYSVGLTEAIHKGSRQGMFKASHAETIEETVHLINDRLSALGKEPDIWGLIHGDLDLSNIIAGAKGSFSFIDFGFFGSGYYMTDVALGALMLPSDQRTLFIESYFENSPEHPPVDIVYIEGLMLIAIIGFYVFKMGNEQLHEWMRSHMQNFCTNRCLPYLNGERILHLF